jgi:hypothetical protein
MNPMLESSGVVEFSRRVARGSIVLAPFRWLASGIRAFDEALARAVADKDGADDTERIAEVARTSRVVQGIDRLFAAPGLAWQDSRARPLVESLAAAVRALSSAERVRLLGWMLAVALVTRALLYVVSGAELTPTTLTVWGVVFAIAAVMMAAAGPVANAWDDWKARRL